MSPIDERLKSLNIVLPDVTPPIVDGYVPAFAPFTQATRDLSLMHNRSNLLGGTF
jgi:hypothetical protein